MQLWNWFRRTFQTRGWIREESCRWASRHFPEQERVAAIVGEILVEQVGVGFDALRPDTRFIEELGMDDLEPAQVVMALEEEFGISIPDEDSERLCTVEDLIRYVRTKVQAKTALGEDGARR